jgi:hypothetical protein
MTVTSDNHEAKVLSLEVDKNRFPHLAQLLEQDETLREELGRLLVRPQMVRAPRHEVRVLAKLVRQFRGETVEESVIVRDISETGMRVTVPKDLTLDFFETCHPEFRLQVGEGEYALNMLASATLVRVAGYGKNGANLAFRFRFETEQERAALRELARLALGGTLTNERPRLRTSRASGPS